MARPCRELAIAHGAQLPAERLLGDRDAELLEDPFACTASCGGRRLENIRLSSDMTNPLSRNQHWRADSDGWIGLCGQPVEQELTLAGG